MRRAFYVIKDGACCFSLYLVHVFSAAESVMRDFLERERERERENTCVVTELF